MQAFGCHQGMPNVKIQSSIQILMTNAQKSPITSMHYPAEGKVPGFQIGVLAFGIWHSFDL
jgi:hypothetical protein